MSSLAIVNTGEVATGMLEAPVAGEVNILVEGGHVSAMTADPLAGVAEHVLDVGGAVVMPGPYPSGVSRDWRNRELKWELPESKQGQTGSNTIGPNMASDQGIYGHSRTR